MHLNDIYTELIMEHNQSSHNKKKFSKILILRNLDTIQVVEMRSP